MPEALDALYIFTYKKFIFSKTYSEVLLGDIYADKPRSDINHEWCMLVPLKLYLAIIIISAIVSLAQFHCHLDVLRISIFTIRQSVIPTGGPETKVLYLLELNPIINSEDALSCTGQRIAVQQDSCVK